MSLCGTDQDKKRLLNRLKKIEGQIRGIEGMVERECGCIEVLRQINSATGALRGAWNQVVGEHLRGCVSRADSKHNKIIIDELIEHLQKIK